jgi:putative endonuclease
VATVRSVQVDPAAAARPPVVLPGAALPGAALPAFVYIVRCADGTLYTGWALDPARRVAEHNAGQGARYTRGRRPVRLVYSEACTGRADAQRREAALKRLSRRAKLQLIRAGRASGRAA